MTEPLKDIEEPVVVPKTSTNEISTSEVNIVLAVAV